MFCYTWCMAKRRRAASPFIPNWPDAITMDDLKGIRDHWADCITEYTTRVAQGQVTWERHLRIVQERHRFWADLVKRRGDGEKITSRVRDFLRVQ